MKCLYLFWSFLQEALYSLPFTDLKTEPPPREGHAAAGPDRAARLPGVPRPRAFPGLRSPQTEM